jgi:hypothetical protein
VKLLQWHFALDILSPLTASWVLQGPNSRCTGQLICPGSAADQNSYRSEVSGLLAILMMVDQFATFFHIKHGSIEINCDGESALNKIFSYVSVLRLNEPCYDLIFIAQKLWHKYLYSGKRDM